MDCLVSPGMGEIARRSVEEPATLRSDRRGRKRLVEALVSEGRMEDVARAASDADARNALFEEFGITR